MKVEIRFANQNQTLLYAILFWPSISLWLAANNIKYTMEIINAFEWFEDPSHSYFQGISGEVRYKGRRYIFENEEDAVHFKLRWGLTEIDESDEWVQKYLNSLQNGCNQIHFTN